MAINTPGWAQTSSLERAIETEKRLTREAAESQKRIDSLDDKTRQLFEQYRQTLWEADQQQAYARELNQLLEVQEQDKEKLQAQLDSLSDARPEVEPLMFAMLDSLSRFVEVDLPFLQDERQSRIAKLRSVMADGEITLPEKFRRLLEAYQVEIGYGRKLGAERGRVKFADGEIAVEMLRIGRLMLFYQSLDGRQTGYWDNTARRWRSLEGGFSDEIRQGIRIANEQATPQLLVLPVPSPEAAAP